jgi:hypothetical protein
MSVQPYSADVERTLKAMKGATAQVGLALFHRVIVVRQNTVQLMTAGMFHM